MFHERDKVCADCGTVTAVEGYEHAKGSLVIGHVIGADPANERQSGYYRISIDMDRGQTRSVNVRDPAGLMMGSKVRIVNGNIEKVAEKVAE